MVCLRADELFEDVGALCGVAFAADAGPAEVDVELGSILPVLVVSDSKLLLDKDTRDGDGDDDDDKSRIRLRQTHEVSSTIDFILFNQN